ncbi:hypothetical protein LTR15_001820 [Elasticomyces elasticus]|nr:hypothetical protein LTR15_001820 [Elasticomyces elasticus]
MATQCFEIRAVGNRGVGVFATRTIPAGTLIVKEKPIITFSKNSFKITGEEVELGYADLSASSKSRFDALRTIIDMPNRSHDKVFSTPEIDLTNPRVLNRLRVNSNACSDDGGCGVYDTTCRFNHACKPNATRLGTGRKSMECWSISKIQAGQEITVCYHDAVFSLTATERQQEMPLWGYRWKCECDLCTGPADELRVSDMRRKLIRHLHILFNGADLPVIHNKLSAHAVKKSMIAQIGLKDISDCTIPCMWMMATLLDTEGAVLGGEVANHYAEIANQLLNGSRRKGIYKLPAAERVNFLAWRKRCFELFALLPGGGENGPPVGLLNAIRFIPEDGTLCTCEH